MQSQSIAENRIQGRRACVAGLLAIGLLAATLGPALAADPAAAPGAAKTIAKTVRLVVDFDDGVELHFTRLPWKKGLSVADAVGLADARPHGVKFTLVGAGETALVTKIGDLKNEGGGRDKRNWLYTLNGKLGEIGIGAQDLEPGDVVLWKFDRYDYNSKAVK